MKYENEIKDTHAHTSSDLKLGTETDYKRDKIIKPEAHLNILSVVAKIIKYD